MSSPSRISHARSNFPQKLKYTKTNCNTYPDKAVMEMHSNEASSNAWILRHRFGHSISYNWLRPWTAFPVVTNLKWRRGSSYCGYDTRQDQTTTRHQFHALQALYLHHLRYLKPRPVTRYKTECLFLPTRYMVKIVNAVWAMTAMFL